MTAAKTTKMTSKTSRSRQEGLACVVGDTCEQRRQKERKQGGKKKQHLDIGKGKCTIAVDGFEL